MRCSARTHVYVGPDMTDTALSLLGSARELPEHEAIRLLLLAAQADRSWMVGDPEVTGDVADRFLRYVARRRRREPIQYIEGSTHFGPIKLRVDKRALIPRPETERLWELCVNALHGRDTPVIVDLCTGSGNLALALQHALPRATTIATDMSAAAITLAKENAEALGLGVTFEVGDLFTALPETLRGEVDLIVSNPPYVSNEEYRLLPSEISEHEPSTALLAGPDGLDVLRRIAAEAITWLRPGGTIACEIGETQGDPCMSIFARYRPRIEKDLTDRDRFVLGSAPMAQDVH